MASVTLGDALYVAAVAWEGGEGAGATTRSSGDPTGGPQRAWAPSALDPAGSSALHAFSLPQPQGSIPGGPYAQPSTSSFPGVFVPRADTCALTDWGMWMSRMANAVRRNRLEDVRALLATEAWLRRPHGGDLVTWLPPERPTHHSPASLSRETFGGPEPSSTRFRGRGLSSGGGGGGWDSQEEPDWSPGEEGEAGRGDGSREGLTLATDIAASARNTELLVMLVAECGAALSRRGLRVLVRKWEEVPQRYGGAQGLLAGLVLRSARPLAVVGCVLSALRWEVALREAGQAFSSAELRAAAHKFKACQSQLLADLAEVPTGLQAAAASRSSSTASGADRGRAALAAAQPPASAPASPAARLVWLSAVLDPPPPARPGPLLLEEASPVRLAFEDRDVRFMASTVPESYTRQKWLGRDFLALTSRSGSRELTPLDPLLAHTLLRRLGLAGRGPAFALLQGALRLWYLACVVPRSFFDSPRGRWWARAVTVVAFTVLISALLMADNPSIDDGLYSRSRGLALAALMAVYCGGSLVEAGQALAGRHGGQVTAFVSRSPLGAAVLACEAAVFCLGVLLMLWLLGAVPLGHGSMEALIMVAAATLMPLYVKVLMTLVPLFPRLGSLLATLAAMAGDLAAFALPFAAATLAFAAALAAVYRAFPGCGFSNIPEAALSLFSAFLGNFDLDTWSSMPSASTQMFGRVLLVAYLVLGNILLANLLIAIISYRYRPERVAAEAVFGLAEVVDEMQHQVDRHALCSPLCLLAAPATRVLPSGLRPAVHYHTLLRWGLPPLEGHPQVAPHTALVPTGGAAVPGLLLHLTLHPLMLAAASAVVWLHAPLAVAHYVMRGHERTWAALKAARATRAAAAEAARAEELLAAAAQSWRQTPPPASFAAPAAPPGEPPSAQPTQFTMPVSPFAAPAGALPPINASSSSFGAVSGGSGRSLPSLRFRSDSRGTVADSLPDSSSRWSDLPDFKSEELRGSGEGNEADTRRGAQRGWGPTRILQRLARAAVCLVLGAAMYCTVVCFFITVVYGLYCWLACVLLSVYSVLYEPAVRASAAIHRLRRWVAAVVHRTPPDARRYMGPPSIRGTRSVGSSKSGRGRGAQAAPEPLATRSRASLRRPVTPAAVVQRWSGIANETWRQASAGARYLNRAQVAEAVKAAFGELPSLPPGRCGGAAGPRPASRPQARPGAQAGVFGTAPRAVPASGCGGGGGGAGLAAAGGVPMAAPSVPPAGGDWVRTGAQGGGGGAAAEGPRPPAPQLLASRVQQLQAQAAALGAQLAQLAALTAAAATAAAIGSEGAGPSTESSPSRPG
ncbi:hypothetical protein HYH03_018105 [Edaphochlamys debaryana]|uniref:Polycystin cation channel PKD1/PKD2 domain-containing protein n=1 Tax=Edaphochlamys debaryana TaxID=47281 RepID=A0A836BNG7_9CHLO|nr:hypothetical protein HYH03_018105 [Edaphochlamys debaryana]|eukprot:KAG2483025.1 hypothetical protein HYH03_018105 [Edaphochlamys debaryana]